MAHELRFGRLARYGILSDASSAVARRRGVRLSWALTISHEAYEEQENYSVSMYIVADTNSLNNNEVMIVRIRWEPREKPKRFVSPSEILR